MQLTVEQQQIIASQGNIKINAIAGSGKTTSLIEYAKPRSRARILYLAFNKTVKLEALEKFKAAGLRNVRVETAHSLAYQAIVRDSHYKLTPGYTTYDLKRILNIAPFDSQMSDYILTNHVSKFTAYFCNHKARKVRELNYADIVDDPRAKEFVMQHYTQIERLTRIFLAKMDRAEIDITHDFYLKKYQLSNPQLGYDYILFDEGQDASPTMLEVFLQQPATKVIVGDLHQQIYGWRYAINSLDEVDYPLFRLSNSFRFDSQIAQLAEQILLTKSHFMPVEPVSITGLGRKGPIYTRATLARTNLALLLQAIEYTTENPTKKIYFEGNINSYTYASEGGSIYDVLFLYLKLRKKIRDPLIRSMRNFEQLEIYADKIEDMELKMMIQIVEKHAGRLPTLIKNLKNSHVDDDMKQEADMIFSTVHKSKGMEYDEVHLAPDFVGEERIKKMVAKNLENTSITKLSEEVNLLYVAVTRTKKSLYAPIDILPFSAQKELREDE